MASLETQLRQQGEQKHRAEADLTAVRDLCMKLDEQKDTLMAQLDDKDSLKTQVKNIYIIFLIRIKFKEKKKLDLR